MGPALYLKVFPAFELVHDRQIFVPTLVLGIALAAGLKKFCAGSGKVWPLLVVGVLLVAATAENVVYQGVWKNDLTLFQRAVELTPNNDRALVNLGVNKLRAGEEQEGIALLQRALLLNPNNAFAWLDLGLFASSHNDLPAAALHFEKAVALEPRPYWWILLAQTQYRLGHIPEAEQAATQAAAQNPAEEAAHLILGLVRLEQNNPAGAIREFNTELHFYPGELAAQQGLQTAQQRLNAH
jgi:tetratricopeptide (TPR) repeat protein